MPLSGTALKVIVTGGIFGLTLLASLLPYKFRASKRFLSVCNVFAGGIFLAAGLCHLLADSVEQFDEYWEERDHHHDDDPTPPSQLTHGDEHEHFPWPYAMMGVGFMTTLFVELIAHKLTHTTNKDKSKDSCDGSAQSLNSQTEPFLPAQGDYLADSSVNNINNNDHHNHSHGGNHPHQHNKDNIDPHQQGLIATPENSFYSNLRYAGESSQRNHEHGHGHGANPGGKKHEHGHDHDDEHGHSHLPMNTENQSLIVAFALFLALSFHSIIEGISLGSSSDDSMKSIMIAILAHKGLESFSLGTSLINSNASILKYAIFCLLFSCMTPVGVLIGALVEASTEGIVSAFITAFAAGTFTYVAVVEVLIPEFKKQQDLILKALALSAGFAGMAVIALWV